MRATQPDPPNSEEIPVGLAFARLGHSAMELYTASLIAAGLRPPHYATLKRLQTAPVGQQALGEATQIDPVKLVGILNDLESAGLVERRRDCSDRRRHIVMITPAGQTRLGAVEIAAAAVEERLLAGLSTSQRTQLEGLLRLISATSRLAQTCPDAEPNAELAR